jgi:hypothetical protein
MTDRMMEEWMRQHYWEGDEEVFWNKCKADFAKKPEAGRLQDLHAVNTWLDQEHRPTREHAALLSRRREMEDLHRALKGIGR